ncbi:MAG TPA: glycosyltransferase family 39 protein, partial [Pirellulales bacterium]|nr:glycosyltransferase family 39 protein [Pirellulales bacterium]
MGPRTGAPPRWSLWLLAAIMVAFVVVRGPLMYRQYGGQDEDCYAVPGLTVAREGIPRLPYAPARNHDSYFYRIDEALFCEPPGSFYWQAPFFLVLPAGYGAARAASAVAGLIAVIVVYHLGRRMLGGEAVGLWAAGLYSVSRLFFFPATTARPDMLCGLFGLAALLATWSWHTAPRARALATAGALVGLGMLTHPFAIVYCLQVGAWVFFASRGWRRLTAPALLVGCALAAFALWIPLIVAYPELFRVQFFNNIVHPAAPGMAARMLVPWDSLLHHGAQLIEHAQVPQLVLMSAGLLASTALALAWRKPCAAMLVSLTWSSCFLLSTAAGVRPSKGYWCYPGALLA